MARVLSALGRDVVVTGLLGGVTGELARSELAAAGLVEETVAVAGESRVTIVVVEDDGRVTGFSELGPEVSAAEWAEMHARFGELSARAQAVVLAGSLPRGVPEDAYGQLVSASAAPVVLDAEGAALLRGVSAGPAVVAINRAELAGVVGGSVDDVVVAADSLRSSGAGAGAGAVVVSCGADGLVAVTGEGVWSASPPEVMRRQPDRGRRRGFGGAGCRHGRRGWLAGAAGRGGGAVGGSGGGAAGGLVRSGGLLAAALCGGGAGVSPRAF